MVVFFDAYSAVEFFMGIPISSSGNREVNAGGCRIKINIKALSLKATDIHLKSAYSHSQG